MKKTIQYTLCFLLLGTSFLVAPISLAGKESPSKLNRILTFSKEQEENMIVLTYLLTRQDYSEYTPAEKAVIDKFNRLERIVEQKKPHAKL